MGIHTQEHFQTITSRILHSQSSAMSQSRSQPQRFAPRRANDDGFVGTIATNEQAGYAVSITHVYVENPTGPIGSTQRWIQVSDFERSLRHGRSAVFSTFPDSRRNTALIGRVVYETSRGSGVYTLARPGNGNEPVML